MQSKNIDSTVFHERLNESKKKEKPRKREQGSAVSQTRGKDGYYTDTLPTVLSFHQKISSVDHSISPIIQPGII